MSLRLLGERAEQLHRPGQRGTGVLLRLLHARRNDRPPDSWFERVLERCVDDPDLPPLVRQHAVRDEHGRPIARLDVAFPSIRLALEAHSRRFHFGARAERLDEQRDLQLAALCWEVLYVGWQHTTEPDAVRRLVRQVAHRRSAG